MIMKQKIYLKLVFMIIALVFFAFHFSSALACVASRDPRFNYFISYERPHSGMFRDGNEATEIRPTIVDHCEQSPGQFLMVALALRTSRINGRTADISFVKKLNDDSCHLRNNPFPESQGFQERFAHFNHQFDLLRACAYYDISEINGNDIELPDLQPAARIDRVDHRHIRAQGDFVFVKIKRNSRFAIGVGLKQECMDRNFLKQMHLEPSELQALLNTYVSGDSSGSSTNLMPIGSSRVRFVLAAGSDLMPVGSMDQRVESPSWPVTFKTGVEFGSLSIHSQNDSRLKIDFAPLVDNFARTRCVNGICSVENSFSAPIAGLVELVDLGRSRNRVFDSWYFGASAPGQYQGFVESVSRYLDAGLMSVGKRYSVLIRFKVWGNCLN